MIRRAALILALLAGAAGAEEPVVKLLAPCGHQIRYPDSFWRLGPAQDEGQGVVSQLTEVTGDFAHRELELVDCRAGTELFLGDVRIPVGAPRLPEGTPFQARLSALRRAGGLTDPAKVYAGMGTEAQFYALDVDWRSNVNAACACERFYPGTSGLPANEVPAPDRVHGVDAPQTSP